MDKSPTLEIYTKFQNYFDVFNERFFNGVLPNCLITYQRGKGYEAYYMHKAFTKGGEVTDEIAMNPEAFIGKSKAQVLSTYLHELCHLWQYTEGKPSRGGYHNKEWADKMEEVGLQPFGVGRDNYGKRTGQKLNHKIIKGGVFEKFLEEDKKNDFEMWVQRYVVNREVLIDIRREKEAEIAQEVDGNPVFEGTLDNETLKGLKELKNSLTEALTKVEPLALDLSKTKGSKLKYSCDCSSIWGKASLKILCLECGKPFSYKFTD